MLLCCSRGPGPGPAHPLPRTISPSRSRPPGGQAGPTAGRPSRQPEAVSLRAQQPAFPQGSLAPAIGEGTWP